MIEFKLLSFDFPDKEMSVSQSCSASNGQESNFGLWSSGHPSHSGPIYSRSCLNPCRVLLSFLQLFGI